MATATKSNTGETVAWVLVVLGALGVGGYTVKKVIDSSQEKAALEAEARNAREPIFRPAVPRQEASTGQKVLGAVGSAVDALGGVEGLVSLFRR